VNIFQGVVGDAGFKHLGLKCFKSRCKLVPDEIAGLPSKDVLARQSEYPAKSIIDHDVAKLGVLDDDLYAQIIEDDVDEFGLFEFFGDFFLVVLLIGDILGGRDQKTIRHPALAQPDPSPIGKLFNTFIALAPVDGDPLGNPVLTRDLARGTFERTE